MAGETGRGEEGSRREAGGRGGGVEEGALLMYYSCSFVWPFSLILWSMVMLINKKYILDNLYLVLICSPGGH